MYGLALLDDQIGTNSCWLADVTDIGDCCFIAFNAFNEISGVEECKLLELQQDLQLFNNVASFIASLLKEVQSL